MASKSTVTQSEERGEVGVGKMRAVLLVKWQNGGQWYQREKLRKRVKKMQY